MDLAVISLGLGILGILGGAGVLVMRGARVQRTPALPPALPPTGPLGSVGDRGLTRGGHPYLFTTRINPDVDPKTARRDRKNGREPGLEFWVEVTCATLPRATIGRVAESLAPRLLTGDAAFDDLVDLLPSDALPWLVRLDATARLRLSVAVQAGWSLREGVWGRRHWPSQGNAGWASAFAAIDEALVDLLAPFDAEVWGRRVWSDESPVLRAELVRTGAREGWLDPLVAVNRLEGEREPLVQVALIGIFGDEGQPDLLPYLDHADADARSFAAVFLAAQRLPDFQTRLRVEARLLEGRAGSVPGVLHALGLVGTAAVIPTLRQDLPGWGPARRSLAEEAVRKIQLRLGGDAGELSMVDSVGGELSMQPEDGG